MLIILAVIIILLSRISRLTFIMAKEEGKTRQEEIDQALEKLSESQVDRLISFLSRQLFERTWLISGTWFLMISPANAQKAVIA